MNYENLLETAFNDLPEFKEQYDREIKNDSIDADSGMHTVFSFVFVPLLSEAMKKDKELSSRMFKFIEKMERCKDTLVQEVSAFTVLEELCDEHSNKTLEPFLLAESKESLKRIRQYIKEQ